MLQAAAFFPEMRTALPDFADGFLTNIAHRWNPGANGYISVGLKLESGQRVAGTSSLMSAMCLHGDPGSRRIFEIGNHGFQLFQRISNMGTPGPFHRNQLAHIRNRELHILGPVIAVKVPFGIVWRIVILLDRLIEDFNTVLLCELCQANGIREIVRHDYVLQTDDVVKAVLLAHSLERFKT